MLIILEITISKAVMNVDTMLHRRLTGDVQNQSCKLSLRLWYFYFLLAFVALMESASYSQFDAVYYF